MLTGVKTVIGIAVTGTLSTSEDELSHMKEICESSQKELADLLEKQAAQNEQVIQLTEKLKVLGVNQFRSTMKLQNEIEY
ncbi:hypothetical protein E2C01_077373 [Portunus trituberculatus]|uniref:Uncharacterized protein n=1 Tax=Portunus trituberculatus TaxID=210409 RepID=A0A5B7IK50_PORTR|nr:hypothetical protein [Portunus trituberculatus]